MQIVRFRGRIDRRTFLALTVLLYGVSFVLSLLIAVGASHSDNDFPLKDIPDELRGIAMPQALGWTFLVAGLVGLCWVLLGMIATSVRRLHDCGLTGFLVLLYPVLKYVIPDAGWPDWLPGPADLLWTLVMAAQPGTRGPNAFGPNPRSPAPEVAGGASKG